MSKIYILFLIITLKDNQCVFYVFLSYNEVLDLNENDCFCFKINKSLNIFYILFPLPIYHIQLMFCLEILS